MKDYPIQSPQCLLILSNTPRDHSQFLFSRPLYYQLPLFFGIFLPWVRDTVMGDQFFSALFFPNFTLQILEHSSKFRPFVSHLFKFSPFKELIYSSLSTTISIVGITSLSLSLALNFVPNSTPTFSSKALHYFTTQTQLIVFPLNISSCCCIFCPAPHDSNIVLIVWSQNCKSTCCFSFFPEWLIPYQLFCQWFCQLFYSIFPSFPFLPFFCLYIKGFIK